MYTIIPNSQMNAVTTTTITISQKTMSGALKTRWWTTIHKLYYEEVPRRQTLGRALLHSHTTMNFSYRESPALSLQHNKTGESRNWLPVPASLLILNSSQNVPSSRDVSFTVKQLNQPDTDVFPSLASIW